MNSKTITLEADYVVAGPDSVVENGAVVVSGRDIVAVGERELLHQQWPDAEVMTFDNCLLMPGLVNAHQHGRGLSQIQLGYYDDFLEPWIAARRSRGTLDGEVVTKLAAARMIANGVTTTIHANYSYGTGDYPNELRGQIRAYQSLGLRHTMCVGAMDRGNLVYPPHEACFMAGLSAPLQDWLSKPGAMAYCKDAPATIALMTQLRADYQDSPLTRLCYGPAGPQWVSDDMWYALAKDARDNGLGIHLHAMESPAQRDAVKELFPEGAFAYLDRLGAMTERTVVAHGVWVDQQDMDVLARSGATVVRNPGCNIRMRNGIAPLARYLASGVRVAVGTDNCSMQDDEDILSELRLAGNLGREPDWNAPPPPASGDLIAMATINGAIAAQFGAETGLLKPGRRADISVFSLERTKKPYLDAGMPMLDAFLARGLGSDARMTMVEGKILYLNGRYADADIDELEEMAADAAKAAGRPDDPSVPPRAEALRDALRAHYKSVSIAE